MRRRWLSPAYPEPVEGKPGAGPSTGSGNGGHTYSLRDEARAAWWAALAAVLVLAGMAYLHFQLPALDGVIFAGLGLAAFSRALGLARPLAPLPVAEAVGWERRHLAGRSLALATALVAVLLALMALAAALAPGALPPTQLLTLAAAGAWLLFAFQLRWSTGTLAGADGRGRPSSVRRHLPWLAVLVLASAVRFTGLEELPPGLWFDEAGIGLEARRILEEPHFRPMYAHSTTSPAAYIYLVAAAEAVLGQTITGVRAVSALSGTATALLAYWTASSLWGRGAGLAAGVLFAVARWDTTFSRIGMQGATTPTITVAAFGLGLLALRGGHPAAYAGLGLVLGGSLWFYGANVFFLPVMAVGLGLVTAGRGSFLRDHRSGLALALAGALLVAAPVLADGLARPEVVFSRAEVVSVFREKSPADAVPSVLESLRKHLSMFNLEGDRNGRHNLPRAPMLDPGTGALALLGLAAAVHQAAHPALAGLLAWLLLLLLPGVLSLPFEAPQALRSIGAVPAVLLLAALGLERLRSFWAPRLGRRATGVLLAAWVAAVGAVNLHTYFRLQASDADVWNAFSMAPTIIARHLAGDPAPDHLRYVSPLHTGHPTIAFLASAPHQMLEPGRHLPLSDAKTTTVFAAPEEEAVYEQLQSYYPEAGCRDLRHNPSASVILYQCTITADQARAPWGLQPEGDRLVGSLHAPVSGPYRLGLEGDAGRGWSLDERAMGSPAEVLLTQGLHAVSIEGRSARLFWQTPGGPWEPVPAERLFHGSVRPMGLTVGYYRGTERQGEPAFTRIEAGPFIYYHLLPLPLPFVGAWSGSLYAPATGQYRFSLSTISEASIGIDGAHVVSVSSADPGRLGTITLAEGWHRIQVGHLAAHGYAQLYLRWQPPGGTLAIIPPRLLRPW